MFKRKLPKLRKGAWFYRVRWSYLPATWQAWLLYVPYVAYLAGTAVFVYRQQHDALRTIMGTLLYWAVGVLLMQWIASHKS